MQMTVITTKTAAATAGGVREIININFVTTFIIYERFNEMPLKGMIFTHIYLSN